MDILTAASGSSYSTGDVMLFSILILCIILTVFAVWGRFRP